MKRFLTAIITLNAWTVPVAVAQHSEADSTKKPHGRTFSTGPREGWTFSSPHIDIAGGVYMEPNHDPKVSEGFFRLHMQTAVGPKLAWLLLSLAASHSCPYGWPTPTKEAGLCDR